MKQVNFPIYFLLLSLLITGCQNDTSTSSFTNLTFEPIPVEYPNTYRDTTIVDDYHGKKVADPYRWLEDDDAEETEDWVRRQNRVAFTYLDQIPYQEAILDRLEALYNYERFSTPFKRGDKYYYFHNSGLQNQNVLYVQEDLQTEEMKEVLDPNTFSDDGTVALGGISFSEDGEYLAYQVTEGGSDWHKAYVKNLETGETLKDELNWLKFTGISWYKDGFYYSRYPAPKEGEKLSGKNQFHQVYYHQLGTNQEEDRLVFADRSNPSRGFGTTVTEDERYLVLNVWESTSGNALYFKDLNEETIDFTPIVEDFKNDYSVIGNDGERMYVLTSDEASNQRLVAINAQKPERGYWEEIIPEGKDLLEGVYYIGGKLIALYLHDAYSKAKIFDLDGKYLADIDLPGIGTVSGFSGKKDDNIAFYSFNTFTGPSTIYQIDLQTLESTKFKEPKIDFPSDQYTTKQVFYKSLDGTEVPMFIVHKKGLELDGKRPTLLYGYGGFNISLKPGFSISRTILLENDGVYAVANLRGGGEFGKDWHQAGTKERKQNVFNDFIAAAEFLQDNGYTNSDKLAIQGGSNGGLLVGACMTQRPDLYKVALPAVGVLDMLRYHLFTIGRAWASDYGLSSDPEAFDYLISYSPLHNIEPANYPATLVTTGDHDDRVVPAHSFKFISELQRNQRGEDPVLIRVETSAGHGAGKPLRKQLEETADWLSFMFYNFKEGVRYGE